MKVSLTTRKGKPNIIPSTRKKRKRDPPPPLPPSPLQAEAEAEEGDITPISSSRPCLNIVDDMNRFEKIEHFYIVEVDPSNSNNTAPTPLGDSAAQNLNGGDDGDDICVIAEKGQVACRDFPHPRHLCVKYPFKTTPHKNHCELCFCYVCDSPAPCKFWTSHFHYGADDKAFWPYLRNMQKCGRLIHYFE